MKRLQDSMYPKTPLTRKQRQAIQEVHDIACAYVALDPHRQRPFLGEIRTLTTGRQRWLATRHTPPDHAAFLALMTMLDTLIDDQGLIKTEKGWFDPEELKNAEVRIERDGDKELIVFPYLYPWRSKPEGNGTGVRDDARYRAPNDRKPFLSTFSQVGPRDGGNKQVDWWDMEDDEQ